MGRRGPACAPVIFLSLFIVINAVVMGSYFFFPIFPLALFLGKSRTWLLSSIFLSVSLEIFVKEFELRDLPEAALCTFTCVVLVTSGFLIFFGGCWALVPFIFLVKLTVFHSL